MPDGGGQIGGPAGGRQPTESGSDQVVVDRLRVDHTPHTVSGFDQCHAVAGSEVFEDTVCELDCGGARSLLAAAPAHAARAVDHDHHVPPRRFDLTQPLGQPPVAAGGSRQGNHQQSHQQHSQQDQLQLLDPHPPPSIPLEFQELHRRPLDPLESLASQQVRQQRQRQAGQAPQHRCVEQLPAHGG